MPRWPHARGTVRLSEAWAWELDREEEARLRISARKKRALRAARNRAWRGWRHALGTANRLLVLYGSPAPNKIAEAAWRDIADAIVECALLKIPGVRWKRELDHAERRVAELTPRHLTRAERRRQQRDERKRMHSDAMTASGRSGALGTAKAASKSRELGW